MLKKLIFKWLLSWMTVYDLIYLIKKLMRRDKMMVLDLDDKMPDGRAMRGRIYFTVKKGP